ncbi:MAG: hypothetical protein Kow00120_03190 [Anaerolineae bacterium]
MRLDQLCIGALVAGLEAFQEGSLVSVRHAVLIARYPKQIILWYQESAASDERTLRFPTA